MAGRTAIRKSHCWNQLVHCWSVIACSRNAFKCCTSDKSIKVEVFFSILMLDESWLGRFCVLHDHHENIFIILHRTDWLLKKSKRNEEEYRSRRLRVSRFVVLLLFFSSFQHFFFLHIFNIKIMATEENQQLLCEKSWTANKKNSHEHDFRTSSIYEQNISCCFFLASLIT